MAHGETKEPRGRNFAFVQLVENLPDNWQKVVEAKMLPMAYVIHDKDVYTEDDQRENPEHVAGTLKKKHVHFFVYFSGKKTVSGVIKLFPELGISYVEKVECKNAYLAYMLHLRQDDKHTYRYEEMVLLNGLRVNFADLANVDFGDVLNVIDEYGITRFSELIRFLKESDPPLFRYVYGHYALVCAYFKDEREG